MRYGNRLYSTKYKMESVKISGSFRSRIITYIIQLCGVKHILLDWLNDSIPLYLWSDQICPNCMYNKISRLFLQCLTLCYPTESNVTLFLPALDIQKIRQQPFKIYKAHISDSIQSMVIYIPDLQFIDAQDITLNAKYFCFAK